MKTKPFELLHSVICDDVRREAGTGKAFYIGVFTDRIIGAAAPVLLERFSVVFCIRETGDERLRRFRVSIEGPPDSQLPSFEEPAYEPQALSGSHTLILQMVGIALPPGTYTARLTVNDHAEFSTPFIVQVDPNVFASIQRDV